MSNNNEYNNLVETLGKFCTNEDQDPVIIKRAVDCFFERLGQLEPTDMNVSMFNTQYNNYSYLPYLLRLRIAFQDNNYFDVANELYSLCHFEDISQRKIYNALMELYHEFQHD